MRRFYMAGMESMESVRVAIPTYDQFIDPILRYLAAHPAGVRAKDAHEAAAVALQLTEDERQQLLPGGTQQVYKNRAGWAHDRLKRAGLSSSPSRGTWRLTEAGAAFVAAHPTPLTAGEVEKIAVEYVHVKLKPEQRDGKKKTDETDIQAIQVASPDERLAAAVEELRSTVILELHEYLKNVSPSFFESIVLDLLHKMGYGASRSDLQRVGGSGDAGIDGIISLDKLGLEKVYVQAKRWQNSVGRPEIQAFYGALAGQRATKGVFITTSAYTAQAIDFARSVEKIVLVDGNRLAELMIDHEVGITSRLIRVPRVDGDYFDEESF